MSRPSRKSLCAPCVLVGFVVVLPAALETTTQTELLTRLGTTEPAFLSGWQASATLVE